MFQPPRRPYTACPRHADPGRDFYVRHGTYRARVHTDPVPRFRCRTCGRTFSRQTFRLSYRDRKPHLNAAVVMHLTGGSWFRKSARDLGLTRRSLEAKARTHIGRIQREMPFTSKRRRYLSLHLELHIARRNWVRPRFYTDKETPAQLAGYAWRRLRLRELIGWRQDWGPRSPCPFGRGTRTVSEPPRAPGLAA